MNLKSHLIVLIKWSRERLLERITAQEQEIQRLQERMGRLKAEMTALQTKLHKSTRNSHKLLPSEGEEGKRK